MRIYKLAGSPKIAGSLAVLSLFLTAGAPAQDRDRDSNRMRDADRYYDRDNNRFTRLLPGTTIRVRPSESIDVERRDERVYRGVIDQDVRGDNGQLAIPRGAAVELIVRVEPDNDLVLDLESVIVNGQRYAIQTDNHRVESARDNSLVGSIVGAIQGGQARGKAVRIPRDSLLTFRMERALDLGVADRGIDRDGKHYHDYRTDRDNR